MTVIFSWVGRRHLQANPPELRLDRPERRWLDQQRLQAELDAADQDRRRLAGPGSKLNAAARRWTASSAAVAAALANARVDLPPQQPPRAGRAGSDVADPTHATIAAVHHTIDHTCITYAHLIGPCPAPDCLVCARDLDTWTALHQTLGLDVDPSTVIDALLGTPPTSRHAWEQALLGTADTCRTLADQLVNRWHHLRRAGEDGDVLTKVADRADEVAGRMRGLEAAVSQWLPTNVRTCDHHGGCGAPAEPGRTTCRAHRGDRRLHDQAS